MWPPLPIIIEYRHAPSAKSQSAITEDWGDLVAALRHHDRIYRITLGGLTGPLMGTLASAMQQPFPMLTYLRVQSCDAAAPSLPDGFLGGLAPRLQKVWLEGIRFPSLPKFLLGSSGIVELRLDRIPHTWDISPQALARCLANLNMLASLSIEFQYPQPLPGPALPHSPPRTRTLAVFPALAILFYKGESEYLEGLVSQIDAPRLSYAFIRLFNQLLFEISELPSFISRTEKLRSLNRAEVFFDGQAVGIGFYGPETKVSRNLTVRIGCTPSDWQLSSLAQLCNQSTSLLAGVEQLDIRGCHSRETHLQEMMQWVDLFHPFTAVESLRIPRELGTRIAPVLHELTEPWAAEVLPALKSLIFEELGPPSESGLQRAIDEFTAARKSSGHLVEVRRWDGKWERDIEREWYLQREWERDFEVKD